MKFYKYNGLGNDFVFVDGPDASRLLALQAPLSTAQFARRICRRQTGVGADGLVLLLPTDKGDIRMRIWNADGSEAEMCGNASRAVALHCKARGLVHSNRLVLDTLAGPIVTEIVDEQKGLVRVNMGSPRLLRGQIPMQGDPQARAVGATVEAAGRRFTGTGVSMGNPHFVIFVQNVQQTPVETWGPALESSPVFVQKTNVEFVQVLSKDAVRMRVWERGAGITQACGTGACATLAACVLNGHTSPQATVKLDGGDLYIEWPQQREIFMTGPAQLVYTGELTGDFDGLNK